MNMIYIYTYILTYIYIHIDIYKIRMYVTIRFVHEQLSVVLNQIQEQYHILKFDNKHDMWKSSSLNVL